MKDATRQVRIVLVRPRNPLNLLAAARAAASFGFDDVVVVSPHGPVWEEARAAAEAGKWLRKARCVENVMEAIEGCNWVLGTTSLSRRKIEPQRVISIDRLMVRAAKSPTRNRIAILFGSEKRGLSNEDLKLCHSILTIPTSAATPSMNLGQAVAVCCYELRQWGAPRAMKAQERIAAATLSEITLLVDELGKILPSGGQIEGPSAGSSSTSSSGPSPKMSRSKERMRQTRVRQMLMRLSLTSEDVVLLLGLIRDLSWRLTKSR